MLEAITTMLPDLNKAFLETIYMVGISLIIALLVGLPLGIFIFTTSRISFLKIRWLMAYLALLLT